MCSTDAIRFNIAVGALTTPKLPQSDVPLLGPLQARVILIVATTSFHATSSNYCAPALNYYETNFSWSGGFGGGHVLESRVVEKTLSCSAVTLGSVVMQMLETTQTGAA